MKARGMLRLACAAGVISSALEAASAAAHSAEGAGFRLHRLLSGQFGRRRRAGSHGAQLRFQKQYLRSCEWFQKLESKLTTL